jgi:hypothetical protein
MIYILLHVHPLLDNVLVKRVPRRQILGKQAVASLRNNRGSRVFSVRGDVTKVDSDQVTCVFCRPDRRANRLVGKRSRDVFTLGSCLFLGCICKADTSYE